jgi:hypothetical protein
VQLGRIGLGSQHALDGLDFDFGPFCRAFDCGFDIECARKHLGKHFTDISGRFARFGRRCGRPFGRSVNDDFGASFDRKARRPVTTVATSATAAAIAIASAAFG